MPSQPTILLTRPQKQAERFAQTCRAAFGDQIEIIISPLLEIQILEIQTPINSYDGLIFSSENGVQAYQQNFSKTGLPAYCVGARTAKAATAAGLQAFTANGTAANLIAMIERENPKGALLHIHGAQTRGEIVQNLQASGHLADGVVAYRQIPVALNHAARAALGADQALILPLFSPATAALFCKNIERINAPLFIIALSQAVGGAVTAVDSVEIYVAETPDAAAMLTVIKRCLGA